MVLSPDRHDDIERLWRLWQIPRPSGAQVVSYRLVLGLYLWVSMLLFMRWMSVSATAWITSRFTQEARGTKAQVPQALRRVCTIGVGVGFGWFTWWLAPLVAFCIKESDGMMPLSRFLGIHGPVPTVAVEIAGPAGVLFYYVLSPLALVQHLGLWASPLILVGSVSLWAFPLASWWWDRRRMMGETAPCGQRPPQALRLGFAVLVGCVGGLIFCTVFFLSLPTTLGGVVFNKVMAIVSPPAKASEVMVWALGGLVLLLQLLVAAVVSSRVPRLPVFHALCATCVAACVMFGGVLVRLGPQVQLPIVFLTILVNASVLFVPPVAWLAARGSAAVRARWLTKE